MKSEPNVSSSMMKEWRGGVKKTDNRGEKNDGDERIDKGLGKSGIKGGNMKERKPNVE